MLLGMVMVLLMVLFAMVLLVTLLSKRHGPSEALWDICNVVRLIREVWVLRVQPAALARVLKLTVIELLGFSLGKALEFTWHESDSWEARSLSRLRKLDGLSPIKESCQAENLLRFHIDLIIIDLF